MFNENTTKQIFAAVLLAILLIFSYMIIKPIFFAAILGLILAYIFRPINKWLLVRIKQPTVTALITCIVVLGALVAITWAFLPILTRQLIEGYSLIQSFDMVGLIKRVFPFLFLTEGSVKTFASAYNTLVSQVIQSSVGSTSDWVKELPSIALKLFVVLIAFFYGLRDGDKMVSILKDTLPFNKSIISRFITKSELVTNSIVYGRVIIGVLTGLLTGLGFYIFGVPGALVLTLIAILVSIIPIIGPWIVWIPVVGILFATGHFTAALLLTIYCLVIVTLFEHIAYPIFISRKSQLSTFLTLIGLIGGMLVFGIFGIILGPLIIAYLSVLFELYRESNSKKS